MTYAAETRFWKRGSSALGGLEEVAGNGAVSLVGKVVALSWYGGTRTSRGRD